MAYLLETDISSKPRTMHFMMVKGLGLLPPNIKPTHPPNFEYSHYAVFCNMLGVFDIRGGGRLIVGALGTEIPCRS